MDQRPARAESGFRHQAMLYAGDDEFVSAAAGFIGEGLDANEPTLVVVNEEKIDRLRAALGADAGRVAFADMELIGRNPARILPAWQQFVDDHRPHDHLRGIGEPIWAGRTPDELVECRLHEALLNVAFDAGPTLNLLCPYDIDTLEPEVIDGARHTHPALGCGAVDVDLSPSYRGGLGAADIFEQALPRPVGEPTEMPFSTGPLHDFRQYIAAQATAAGLSQGRVDDVVLAANEIASNSLRHGGGSGTALVWTDDGGFVCEIRDRGHIDDLFVGRVRPGTDGTRGRGVWMANHLCDLVQVRSSETGTVVRLHMRTQG